MVDSKEIIKIKEEVAEEIEIGKIDQVLIAADRPRDLEEIKQLTNLEKISLQTDLNQI